MPDLIGQRLGQYELTGLIGVGSMASVYQAHPVGTTGTVAIKVVESRLARNPEFVRRFRREAEAIATLNHPHIVRLFGYGEQEDWLYLVMELLTGGSLAQRLRENKLPAARVARYLDQIASALDFAHGESIIHRDLKPQNVLFNRQGQVILTDFGIASLMTADVTRVTTGGTVMGTPAYMAPEQWQSRDVDGRADLYALGIIAFEMLAGQAPFSGDTPFELMHAHIYEAPPPIRAVRPDLPESVEIVLEKALAKAREARFQRGSAFAEAFRIALSGKVPAWLDMGVPPDTAAAAVKAPRRRASRRQRPADLPAQGETKPASRRLGLLTLGLLGIVAVVVVAALLLVSRNRNGAGIAPTTTLQPALAPSLTPTAVIRATATRPPVTNTAVLGATITPTPSDTASATLTPAPTRTQTLDIPATVAIIVAQTDTAVALAASPTPSATPSLTPEPPQPDTATPDIPATVAVIVAQTDTAVALAASPTPSLTPTGTPSRTWTPTPSTTPSSTASPTLTATPSLTPSTTFTPSHTPDILATVDRIVAQTNTAVALSASPTPSITPTSTPSVTATFTPTATPSPTASATSTATVTPTPSVTLTPTGTPDIPATVAHIVALTNTAAAASATVPAPGSTPDAVTAQTLTATITTTATSETGAVAVTTAASANLRAGPGASFVRLGIARLGDTFAATGRTVDGYWFQIILPDGRRAWVSAGLVQIMPLDVLLPVITPTPTETATPET